MRLRPVIKSLFFWGVPIVATLLLLISGFVYWLVATPTGTRWALNTAAVQFDGESRGVQGSLWQGLSFEHLSVQLPDDLHIEMDAGALSVDWKQLWQQRQLRVNELSAQRVAVAMDGEPKPDDPDDEPFVMPELPVSVQVDRLALGELAFTQQGETLPIDLSQLQLQATAHLNNEGAELGLESLRIGYEEMWLDTDGVATLNELAEPWDSIVQLQTQASSNAPDSPLCMDQFLPDHLHTINAASPQLIDPNAPLCAIHLYTNWEGSLDEALVTVVGAGQGVDINARSQLQLSESLPLRDSAVHVALPDGSILDVALDWQRDESDVTVDQLSGTIQAQKFDVGAWLPEVDLAAIVSLEGSYTAQLSQGATELDHATIDIAVTEGSHWNQQPLQGQVVTELLRMAERDDERALWQAYTLKESDIDLRIGSNHLQLQGGFGLAEDHLAVLVDAPALQQLWPDLDEIGATHIDAELGGTLFEHQLQATFNHQLSETSSKQERKLGEGALSAQLQVDGELDLAEQQPSWQGHIQQVGAEHAGFGLTINEAFDLAVAIPTEAQPLAVDVGAFTLGAAFDGKPWIQLINEGTSFNEKGLRSQGHTEPIPFSSTRLTKIIERLSTEDADAEQRGGVVDTREHALEVEDLALVLDWDVTLADALEGEINVQHVAGDVIVPAEPPFTLGLETAQVAITATPRGGGRSDISLDALIETEKMGYIKANGGTPIHYSADGGFELRNADAKTLDVDAHMDSLAWTSLILGDDMELGGELIATMQLQGTADGGFESRGDITGHHLKVTRLDDGVRLLDGELEASLDNNRFTVEKLHFPAQLRVEPKEWRTATWIREEEEASNGYLEITGYWDVADNSGNFDIELDHYPILQRADRYAMVSGDLHMRAVLPHIDISGKITADAGWFDLDMLGSIPTIDGDIVVVRSTDTPVEEDEDEEEAAPIDVSMDLDVDLGPRFYLTGYGVNSGLIGEMNIRMVDNQITALGALNTRGGAIEVYGQRLQLRRGTITFQGDIANPILDIQALRTGLNIEAGVKVGGTASKPVIELISVPEVSELEKLSWLLFGHGPDEAGGDLALLVSVGSSLLSDGGEPFYKKFGIDELTMRSGELGGSGSILPATSTASSFENELSEAEQQFIQASKRLSSDIRLSIRQALSDTGTVGRASYRLTRRLSAELSVGTVNGLGLIYRWFSMD